MELEHDTQYHKGHTDMDSRVSKLSEESPIYSASQ